MGSNEKLPIVIISMSRWDGDFSSASWSLAKTFAKYNKVIYVDYPYTYPDVYRERKEPRLQKRKKVLLRNNIPHSPIPDESPNLYYLTPPPMIPVNWLPGGKMYDLLADINQRKLERSILRSLKLMKIDEFILLNSFNPFYFNKKPKYIHPKFFIYQSRDDISQLDPYLVKHGVRLEIKALKNADLNLATSSYLKKLLEQRSGADIKFLPNAADIQLFEKAYLKQLKKPEDLKNLKGKVIGYTGNICQRLDYELINFICKKNPTYNFVMVGPKNFYPHTKIDLENIENLIFTGKKDIKELPDFLAHFDALLLPFKSNELTRSIYPLKINEYLASGKPVISTRFSEDIIEFGEIIALADDKIDFNEAVRREITNDTPEKRNLRHRYAAQNSWEQRVALFYNLLKHTENN